MFPELPDKLPSPEAAASSETNAVQAPTGSTLRLSAEDDRTIINSLSAHIAILDANGAILETNRAWREFARNNGLRVQPGTLHINYLTICDAAHGESAEESQAVAEGIRSVIAGQTDEFLLAYPCHSPTEQRWFYLRAKRIEGPGPAKVVVSHENITALKLAEERLREHQRALEEKTHNLEEVNTALKVLLRQREEDKRELEQRFLTNLKQMVWPYVEKLKNSPLKPNQRTLVTLLADHLNDVISPLLQHLSSANLVLTPQEIQVAALVKDGKSSKDIAELLNISITTVHFHRKNIRTKLGLSSRKTNLRAYLMSLSE